MTDSIIGAGSAKINQTGQIPTFSEPMSRWQETYYKEHKNVRYDGEQSRWVSLDLAVRLLNKEYFQLRQEGEKRPPSCTEQIAGRKGLRKGWA